MVEMRKSDQTGAAGAPRVEANGINVIDDAERKGSPIQLFWPWFAANVSVLGISYGAFVLGFAISFWQAVVAGLIGIVVSFLLCGFIALAGKRGSAPTMVLCRAAFGVRGNKLPTAISWLLDRRLGDRAGHPRDAGHRHGLRPARLGGGTAPRSSPCSWWPRSSSAAGSLGFDVIMRMQTVHHDRHRGAHGRLHRPRRRPDRLVHGVRAARRLGRSRSIGALVFVMTGFGLGWVNAAADYSRYLPRDAPRRRRRRLDDVRLRRSRRSCC